MRTVIAVAFLGLLACVVAVSAEQQNDALLAEMKKCAICKEMAENPKLMSQVSWETHKIDNGALSVSTVPKESVKQMAALHEKMMKNVEKAKSDLQSGKKVEMCSFCEGMGELEKSGAKIQTIHTSTGAVSLITSPDPEVVKKIHAHADQAIAMQKKMQQAN
jgi:hypothetical protein